MLHPLITAACVFGLLTTWADAQQPTAPRMKSPGDACLPLTLELVPTFECVGVYATYAGDENGDSTASVEYREYPAGVWRQAHSPWNDVNGGEQRTSLVGLTAQTEYEVRVSFSDPDGVWGRGMLLERTQTWVEDPPIGSVFTYPPGTHGADSMTLQSGTSEAWQVYQADSLGAVIINDSQVDSWGFSVSSKEYIIFRNLVFTGGRDAVVVYNSHHIRFENCEVREFGDALHPTRTARGLVMRGSDCKQVVVQDCHFHSPLGSANDWDSWNELDPPTHHPDGPHGIWFWESGGNHVVRRNLLAGDDDHWWSDAICGQPNGAEHGGPYRDVDIYDNTIHHVNDDAIELDGGQINVRCFGNDISRSYVAISTIPCIAGPSYVFRNVVWNIGDSRVPARAWTVLKLGGAEGNPGLGKGSQYIYHNTIYAPYDPGGGPFADVYAFSAIGGTTFGDGAGANKFINVTCRNNIVLAAEALVRDRYYYTPPGTNTYDYDLTCQSHPLALGDPHTMLAEEHGVYAPLWTPLFVDPGQGDFSLLPGSPALDGGVVIPGFNDEYLGMAPDIGALECY